MSTDDGWFERNEAFLNFAGHLAAIGQRNALIQEQVQTQALLRQGIALEQQRRTEEARQENCKNLLYDINQAASLIRDEYSARPQQAYYEAILLNDKMKEIDLNHAWFSELDWKDYCTKTRTTVTDLVAHASSCLSSEQISSVDAKVEAEKRLDQQKQQAERDRLEQETIAHNKAKQHTDLLLDRQMMIGGAITCAITFGVSMLMIAVTPPGGHLPGETEGSNAPVIAALCMLVSVVSGAIAVAGFVSFRKTQKGGNMH